MPNTVLVTGGAGYVGSVLVPKLLAAGHHVKVLDLYVFGETRPGRRRRPSAARADRGRPARRRACCDEIVPGCDAVIHLACISNDPSFELNPPGQVHQLRLLRRLVDVSRRQRRAAVHLRLVVQRLRRSRKSRTSPKTCRSSRSPTTRSTRRCARTCCCGSAAGLHDADPAAGDGLRLVAAAAARPVGQHPHQPRGQQPQDHRVRRPAVAAQPPHRRHDGPVCRSVALRRTQAIDGKIYNAG